MSWKIRYMRKVAIRELQQNIRRVMELVERGETIEITRGRRSIARLGPIRPPQRPAPWPDLDERARSALGARVTDPGAGEQVLRDASQWDRRKTCCAISRPIAETGNHEQSKLRCVPRWDDQGP